MMHVAPFRRISLPALLEEIHNRPDTRARIAALLERPFQFPEHEPAEPVEHDGYDVDFDVRRARWKRNRKPRMRERLSEAERAARASENRLTRLRLGALYRARAHEELPEVDKAILRLLAADPERVWKGCELAAAVGGDGNRMRRRRHQLMRWGWVERVEGVCQCKEKGWHITAKGVEAAGKIAA